MGFKVKETSLNTNSETNLEENITSVTEFNVNQNEKHDQQLPSVVQPSKEVDVSLKSSEPNVEIVESTERENSTTNQNDSTITNKEEHINDKSTQDHIYDSDKHSKVSDSMTDQLPVMIDKSDDINSDASSCQLRSETDTLPNIDSSTDLNSIASAASNIITRGLSSGISSLVSVLGDVIQTNPLDDKLLQQRVERQSEEEKERKLISDAWNSVWNTSWTNDDDDDDDDDDQNDQNGGWEVDFIEESTAIPDKLQSNNMNSSPMLTNPNNLKSTYNSCGEKISSSTENCDVESKTSSNNFSWDWNSLSSISQKLTSSLQATSLNLVQGGVDVLELIGRKTMSVLAENDPGFNYTKKFLRPPNTINNRPNLSKVLREAYELHTSVESNNHQSMKQKRGDFTYQLECSRALLHLESLELVSEQASNQLHARLNSLPIDTTTTTDNNDKLLETIWNNLNLDEIENYDNDNSNNNNNVGDTPTTTCSMYNSIMNKFKTQHLNDNNLVKHNDQSNQQLPENLKPETVQLWYKIIEIFDCLNVIYSNERFLKATTDVWKTCDFDQSEPLSIEEIYFQSISSLAQFTSAYLEYLHKFSECILVRQHKTNIDFIELSQILAYFFQLSVEAQVCLCQEFIKTIKSLPKEKSTTMPEQHQQGEEEEQSTSMDDYSTMVTTTQLSKSQYISNLLLECSHAQNYLKNASNLLISIIQLACLNYKYPTVS
ncbi:unnamed protein product [Schistosoma turkestanicum]|nr:unnamed protein product [Schistosoma turkestanicum]